MRGKRANSIHHRLKPRNIPAYAGKTCLRAFSPNVLSEHPRVCGENEWNTASPITQTGTSPRMRGKRPQHPAPTAYRGNIPAYAGKTRNKTSPAAFSPRVWEHPRVCGENWPVAKSTAQHAGTSPRMRGKRSCFHREAEPHRNIPAYAGKTACILWVIGVDPEHPRVCGENFALLCVCNSMRGTSPRMRGKHRPDSW